MKLHVATTSSDKIRSLACIFFCENKEWIPSAKKKTKARVSWHDSTTRPADRNAPPGPTSNAACSNEPTHAAGSDLPRNDGPLDVVVKADVTTAIEEGTSRNFMVWTIAKYGIKLLPPVGKI